MVIWTVFFFLFFSQGSEESTATQRVIPTAGRSWGRAISNLHSSLPDLFRR